MRESISKGLSEDGMVRKLGEHIDFLIMDIVSEKLRYEKTHELLKTLKDAAVTVVDSESAMIKLAVDGYFSRMEIEKSHFDDIISELMKLKESVDGTITYMQENHKRQTDGEIKDLMEKVYQLTNRIEQLETVPVTVEPKVKTSYRDERPSVVPAVRRDPGETEKLVGKIAISLCY